MSCHFHMADFQGRPKMEKFPVRLKFDTINFCLIISLCIGIRRDIVDLKNCCIEFCSIKFFFPRCENEK